MKNLTLEQLCSKIPSIANEGTIEQRLSSRYKFVNMLPIVEQIYGYGLKPVSYAVRGRQKDSGWKPETAPFTVMFTHGAYRVNERGDTLGLLLTSSHDGIKKFSFRVGLFVQVCSNGLYLQKDELFSFEQKHHGDNALIAVENAMSLFGDYFGQAKQLVQKMQGRTMGGHEKVAFAQKVLEQRGLPIEKNLEAILLPEFKEQSSDSLYDVMNVIQGNSVRANGLRGESRKARPMIMPEEGIIKMNNIGAYEEHHELILDTALSFL